MFDLIGCNAPVTYYAFKERKKVLRRITQIKRLLETGFDEEGGELGKRQKKALEKELLEKRIDLNYIAVSVLGMLGSVRRN
jgi:hypothetical protein